MTILVNRPERLIDLIINHDYWEIIDVQTTIVMSISYIFSKENTIRNQIIQDNLVPNTMS